MKIFQLALFLFGLSAYINSASAYISIVDGKQEGAVKFGGSISNEMPMWEWQVTSEAESLAINMHSDNAIMTVNGPNLEWTFNDWIDVTVFLGQMTQLADTGAPGLTPIISMGPDETEIDGTDDNPNEVKLEANGASGESGHLTLSLKLAKTLGWQAINSGNNYVSYSRDVKGSSELLDFMLLNPAVSKAPWFEDHQRESSGNTWLGLGTDTFGDVFASGAVISNEVVLSFPSENFPVTWSAVLPIIVTFS